ncbi:MAG: asparagine synthase-related protein [Anaerolineae bacterium]
MSGFFGKFLFGDADAGRLELPGYQKALDNLFYSSSDKSQECQVNRARICVAQNGSGLPEVYEDSDSGGVCILHGEIFNFDELYQSIGDSRHSGEQSVNNAERFYSFLTASDRAKLDMVNGVFCAVVVTPSGHLHIVSDRWNVIPVYYYRSANGIIFSSEFTSLCHLSEVPRRLSHKGLFQYFALGRLLTGVTLFEDVHSTSPATVISFGQDGESKTRYWTPQFGYACEKIGIRAERITNAILESARIKSLDQDRFGYASLLSGGLDSRVTAKAVSSFCPHVVAYTVTDFENYEYKMAKRVAETLGITHKWMRRDLDYWADHILKSVRIADGNRPFYGCVLLDVVGTIEEEVVFDGCGFDFTFQGQSLFLPTKYPITLMGKNLFGQRLDRPSSREDVYNKAWSFLHKMRFDFISGLGF